MALRPDPGTVPDCPGVYRFLAADSQVLYVGKAKSLRSRLGSYFADPAGQHPRTAAMVASAARVDWTVVNTEVEALQLEYSWIKEFEPRFNVKYTDDKSYPFLAVTVAEDYPRIMVMRGAKRKGVRYFGPYSHAWAIRETVDQLLRVFPARTCSKGVFRRAAASGRPCLLGYIGKCSAPCVDRVSMAEHREIVDGFCSFVAGDTQPHLRRVEQAMRAAARAEDFETAARLRDDLFALQRALERNAVVLPDRTQADVVALAADELQAAVQVFHVRGGRITGQRGFMVERTIDLDRSELMEQALLRLYGDSDDVPREVLVSDEPPPSDLAQWLSAISGRRVAVRRPERGDKRALVETVQRNAEQSLALNKRKRVGDLTARARAMEDLQAALGLDSAPLRIEGYDISTLQGEDTTGSMVVFEDGLPRTSDYRRFTVSRANAHSDTDAMTEVVLRRFKRYLAERSDASDVELAGLGEGSAGPGAIRRRGFSYPPQLVVVDGARPQARAAQRALVELGIDDVAVCGLAKRLEEIWLPDADDPVILSRSSDALHLLQHLRDEAHRFAIAGHRRKRSVRARGSVLDEVPGLGPAKRKAVLKRFGSVKGVAAASEAELAAVSGIGPRLAAAIAEHVRSHHDRAAPAVNLTTGEVLAPEEPPAKEAASP